MKTIFHTILAIAMLMLAGVSPAAAGTVTLAGGSGERALVVAQIQAVASSLIPPSAALQAALQATPGSQGLSVRLLQGNNLVYVVRVKTGNTVQRILVDAQTGRVIGRR